MSRQVHVHIGRLVLRGVTADEREAIASGLREEIGRQLSHSADELRDRHVAALRLPPIKMPEGSAPEQRGRLAGRAVVRGLVR